MGHAARYRTGLVRRAYLTQPICYWGCSGVSRTHGARDDQGEERLPIAVPERGMFAARRMRGQAAAACWHPVCPVRWLRGGGGREVQA